MEVLRSYVERYGYGFAAYIALERALLAHWLARGGTLGEFCGRLAPAYRKRYGPILLGPDE
ncbi:MAG: hypothetical protein ACRELV_09650 [Longimicrobiales bacterium]